MPHEQNLTLCCIEKVGSKTDETVSGMKSERSNLMPGENAKASGSGSESAALFKGNGVDGQNIREIFAKNLRTWRTWRDLSMKVVARDVGVDESTYCLWEAGKRFPNAENLDAISLYAQVPICRFFKSPESNCGKYLFHQGDEQPSQQSSSESAGR